MRRVVKDQGVGARAVPVAEAGPSGELEKLRAALGRGLAAGRCWDQSKWAEETRVTAAGWLGSCNALFLIVKWSHVVIGWPRAKCSVSLREGVLLCTMRFHVLSLEEEEWCVDVKISCFLRCARTQSTGPRARRQVPTGARGAGPLCPLHTLHCVCSLPETSGPEGWLSNRNVSFCLLNCLTTSTVVSDHVAKNVDHMTSGSLDRRVFTKLAR